MTAANAGAMPRAVYHLEDESESDSGKAESGEDKSESNSGKAESGEDEPETESGTWVFNWEMGLIVHNVNDCQTCNEFAVHYSHARICLHPSYRLACSVHEKAIAGTVGKVVDNLQSRLTDVKDNVYHLRQILIDLCLEMNTERNKLEGCRGRLEEARRGLEKARWDRKAAGDSLTLMSKLSSYM